MKKYVVVTDLDSTLLDHADYSWDKAQEALDLLKTKKIPIIFNSSKTLAELQQLKEEMGNIDPCVSENGSVICWSGSWGEAEMVETPGINRDGILQILSKLKDKFKFIGFSEWTSQDLSEETGLTESQASQALDRQGSEPIKWLGTDEELKKFRLVLAQKNLHLLKGGRFYHVMGMVDKSEIIERLKEVYGAIYQSEICVIALGDSANDKLMLELADIAVVIPASKGENLKLERTDYILAADKGPRGWNTEMIKIIKEGA